MAADPRTHRCDVVTISYVQAKEGMIACKECGRIWDLTEWGWKPDPAPEMSPEKRAELAARRRRK